MKVCPSCHSRFVGGESFCPHDGQKLVDARELSPGELTGSKLDDVVRLDRLVYADQFAERYTGRLMENRRAVFVTVLNQGYIPDPNATRRAETARAKGGNPLPPQINTVLQLHLTHSPPFLIETEPRGPSIQALLEERRTLDWDDAVRLTANLARAAQWLHDNGVPHTGFHPGSVYVTSLNEGRVEVGDWLLEAILAPDSPERQLEAHSGAFVGYVDYMAPETITATDQADIRSAVYSLGCLLYEMILGKPPLPAQTPAETFKRHQHEQPVKLSIAYPGSDLPEDLDAILDMMLAKSPGKRFQAPMAVIGALSSLVEMSPNELAPPLERAETEDEDDLYRTIDMESVDRNEVLAGGKKEKPAVKLSANERRALDEAAEASKTPVASQGPVSGTSETKDDSEEGDDDGDYLGPTHEMAPVPEDAKLSDGEEEASDEETSEPAPESADDADEALEAKPSKKTVGGLNLGTSLSEKIRENKKNKKKKKRRGRRDTAGPPRKTLLNEAGKAASNDDEESSDGDSKKTLMMGSGGFSREESKSGIVKGKKIGKAKKSDATEDASTPGRKENETKDPDSVQTFDRAAISQELGIVDPDADDTVSPEAQPSDETVRVKVDAETLEADAARSADGDEPAVSSAEDSSAVSSAEESSAASEGETEEDAPDDVTDVEEKKGRIGLSPEDAAAAGLTDGEPKIGFVEVDQDRTRDIDRSDWFSSTTEDAWDATMAEEHEERTEKRFRTILGTALGLILVAAAGLFIYSEWIWEGGDEVAEKSENATADEPEEQVDLAALKTAFDEALESERIVAPVGNSALHYLQQLKRHGADSAEYSDAREAFVSVAREKAKVADEAGDLRSARALAGYASQFAPEDEDLKAMVADLQARFTGATPDAGTTESADAGTDAAATDAGTDTKAEETKEPEKPEPKKVATPTKRPERKKPPRRTKPPRGDDGGDSAKKARIAYTRGDVETARRLYHEALKSDPNNAEVLFGLGKVYFDKANYREAVKYQTKAVRYNGSRNDYRIALGQSYYRLGKYKSAIGVWERVLERDPNNNVAKQYVMLAKRKLGD